MSSSSSSDPLLVQAAKGEPVTRPPAWMMRQAGRYMAAYRKLAEKYPSFRERSETTDLIVEISLQPWKAFHPDGVIIFSDILTPLPAFGVPFDIEEVKGPVIQSPIISEEGLKMLHPIDLSKLQFVGDSLQILRQEVELSICTQPPLHVGEQASVLGFVGAPWTIATYIVEGSTTRTYTTVKRMCHTAPDVLRTLLSHLTQAISQYIIFQVESGAQYCWYCEEEVSTDTTGPIYKWQWWPLERMKGTGVDVIGLDWTVDMEDGRRRLGSGVGVQGNVDPAYLFSPLPVLSNEIQRLVSALLQ
ncbi:hypothetical protein Scep_025917 [Stephania cephalantha]|uniref:Uroporphyrinogen decarboxylase (URO-D) domain-containing protein n=1 Tax=Stephania cephalantha TaxID=152367 RepID=A0AAP0ERE0_9MAGN